MSIVLRMTDEADAGGAGAGAVETTARAAKRARQRARVARAIRAIERQVSDEAERRDHERGNSSRESVRLNPAVHMPCDQCAGQGFEPTHLGDGGGMVNCRECGGRGMVSGPPPKVLEAFLRESVDMGHLAERIEQAADEALEMEGVALGRGDWHGVGLETGARIALRAVASALRAVVASGGDPRTAGEVCEAIPAA